MKKPRLHILVCTNRRAPTDPLPSCGPNGGETLIEEFRKQIKDLGLTTTVKVTSTGCLTPCLNGPNVVIYPTETWYSAVQPSDVAEILTAHRAGKTVDRLLLPESVRIL